MKLIRRIQLVIHIVGLSALVVLIPAVVKSWLPAESELSGEVLIGGQPLRGGDLRIKSDNTREQISVPIIDGAFSVRLQPGRHSLAFFQNDPLIFPGFMVEVPSGQSSATLSVPSDGATVSIVDASGAPIASPVVVTLNGPIDDRLYQSTSRIVLDPSKVGQRLAGLSPGDYDLMVHAAGAGTGAEKFRVRKGVVTSVTVKVEPRNGVLEVLSRDGHTISAQVFASGFRRISPVSQGRFPLAQVAPGERIFVAAAGFAPTCRTIRSLDHSIDVVLLPSEPSRTVVFVGSGAPGGEVRNIAGAECPIPLAALTTEISMDGGNVWLKTADLRGSNLEYVQAPGIPPVPFASEGGALVVTAAQQTDSCLRIPIKTQSTRR